RGVSQMAALMLAQLRDVLDSFACHDVAKAVEVWTRDQDIDRLCTSLSQELLAYMMEKSVAMSFGTHLMFCTKNLERMGDHATNIAEAVHYMVSGETLLRERPKADFTSMLTVAMGGHNLSSGSCVHPQFVLPVNAPAPNADALFAEAWYNLSDPLDE